MPPKKPKRKLLVSMCFDLETAETAFYIPTISLYWNIEDAEKPFKMTMRFGWIQAEFNCEYKRLTKYLKKYTLYDLAKVEMMERIPTYTGKFKIEGGYYESETWKAIKVANSQEQIEKWIKTNKL